MTYKYTFNQKDIDRSYGAGFWIGFTTGAILTFALCLIVGLYY